MRLLKFLLVMIVLIIGYPISAAENDNDTAIAKQGTNQPFSAHGYKIDELSTRIKNLELRTELAPADKESLIRNYSESIDKIREIESLSSAKKDYEVKIANTPSELAKYKSMLAEGFVNRNGYDSKMSLEQIEQKLAALKVELSVAQQESSALANEPQRRAARRTDIPKEISAINEQLLKLSDSSVDAVADISLDEIRQSENILKKLSEDALKSKAKTLELELEMYNIRSELLQVRRDYSSKRLEAITVYVKEWEEHVNQRRKEEAETASKEAKSVISEVGSTHEILKKQSNINLEIAKKQSEIALKIENAGRYQKDIEDKLQKLSAEYDRLNKMVTEVGLSPAIGYLLHSKRLSLGDVKDNKANLKKRLNEISQSQFELMDYAEQQSRLDSLSYMVSDILNADNIVDGAERSELSRKLEELLSTRRNSLETLVGYYTNYTSTLTAIDSSEREYVAKFRVFEKFINEHILWVNTQPVSVASVKQVGPEIYQILSLHNWQEVYKAISTGVKNNISFVVLLWLLLLASFAVRFSSIKTLKSLAGDVAIPEHDRFIYTLRAVLITFLYSLPLPFMVYIIGWMIGKGADSLVFAQALSSAFMALALYDIVMMPLRNVFIHDGLAVAHFEVSEVNCRFIYRLSSWFVFTLQPLIVLLYLQHNLEGIDWKYIFSRLIFIVTMIISSIYFAILFNPRLGVLKDLTEDKAGSKKVKFGNLLYLLSIAIPIALAVMAWQGYFYAARQLQVRLFIAFGAGLLFLLAYALILRRVDISRQKIIDENAAETEKKPNTGEMDDPDDVTEEELGDYCDQITRFVRLVLSFAYVLLLFIVFKDIFPALAILDRFELWQISTDIDGQPEYITLARVLSSMAIFVVTILIARNITGLINIALLKSISHKEGTRFAILAIIRYLIAIIGVFWAFAEIGIGWGKVQWLAAAFTVGLGFGLQEIFANFISGIILLFEQPMRVGDIVTVGDVSGKVTNINTRSTTINCWDRRELIIPNKEFITGKLINWTLSDNLNRILFPVGVAYGSDIEKVERTLMRIARFQKGVVWNPKPKVIFKGFGDSCLDFELRAYINDMDDYFDVWHGVNCAIDTEFRKEDIEIAFPQRDLHLKSINSEALSIKLERPLRKPAVKDNNSSITDSSLNYSEDNNG